MMFNVIASGSTIPLAIVAATLKEMNAPMKLKIAAIATAFRGDIARVETLVAIEFAVSWKPFVKSKNSATTITVTRVTVIGGLRVLDDNVRDHVGGCLTGVEATLERLIDVLPADHDQRVDAVVPEQRCESLTEEKVTLILE